MFFIYFEIIKFGENISIKYWPALPDLGGWLDIIYYSNWNTFWSKGRHHHEGDRTTGVHWEMPGQLASVSGRKSKLFRLRGLYSCANTSHILLGMSRIPSFLLHTLVSVMLLS